MTEEINHASFWFVFFIISFGEVCTRFLDMPIVNIGNATSLSTALKSSLGKHGLDFSKAVAFMSDTSNVVKGVQ